MLPTATPATIPSLTLTASAGKLTSGQSPKATVTIERSQSTNFGRRPPNLDIPKETPSPDQQQQTAATEESNGGLVFITILPDEQGRFGFNVKGGVDQKLPIIVSRVGPGTPADK